MYVCVNQNRCAGCGICVDECPSGAICLEDGRAVIDQSRCTGCHTCVENCPNEAIEVIQDQPVKSIFPVVDKPIPLASLQETSQSPVPVQASIIQTTPVNSKRSITLIASAALTYMGREVLPRVIDVMVTALENRIARSAEHNQIPIEPVQNMQMNTNRGGRGNQIRYRGGSGNGRIRKGRR